MGRLLMLGPGNTVWQDVGGVSGGGQDLSPSLPADAMLVIGNDLWLWDSGVTLIWS
jgi:hypothetical protein